MRIRTRLVAAVGHRIVWSLHQHSVVAPSSLVATVLLTHEARGISLSDLADQVSWLCQEVVTRGGLVIPITETGRVVGHTLKQLSSLIHFPEKGKTLEPLFRPRERALLQLGALRNRCLHVFADEALLITCLAARASEGKGRAHWVREDGLLTDFEYLAEVLQLELTFAPATLEDTFRLALARLVSRGGVSVLYDDGYGQRVQLCTSPQARRLVSLLRGMLVPLLDAYWVAALSLLPLRMEAESGVLMGSHLDRMQIIARTMYMENKVHSGEAASPATLSNAFAIFQLHGLITRTPLENGDCLVKLAPQDPPSQRGNAGRAPGPQGEAAPKRLFGQLVEAIKRLDSLRQVNISGSNPFAVEG